MRGPRDPEVDRLLAIWASAWGMLLVAGVTAGIATGFATGEEGEVWIGLLILAAYVVVLPLLCMLVAGLFVLMLVIHALPFLALLLLVERIALWVRGPAPDPGPYAGDGASGRASRAASAARAGRDPLGLYATLELDPRASERLAAHQYRRMARRHHPDLGGDLARMVAINRAWEVIGDPVARASYDRRACA